MEVGKSVDQKCFSVSSQSFLVNKPLKTETIFCTADISLPALFAVLITVFGLFVITGFDAVHSLMATEQCSIETLS